MEYPKLVPGTFSFSLHTLGSSSQKPGTFLPWDALQHRLPLELVIHAIQLSLSPHPSLPFLSASLQAPHLGRQTSTEGVPQSPYLPHTHVHNGVIDKSQQVETARVSLRT